MVAKWPPSAWANSFANVQVIPGNPGTGLYQWPLPPLDTSHWTHCDGAEKHSIGVASIKPVSRAVIPALANALFTLPGLLVMTLPSSVFCDLWPNIRVGRRADASWMLAVSRANASPSESLERSLIHPWWRQST